MREPDWKALADLQFLLYQRIADSLNAAMSAVALSDMPEAQDKQPGFWKDRATAKIENVLNLFMAWSYLIHYKLGEMLPDRAIRPFRVNALLEWLSVQLQLNPPPTLPSNPLLHANQETLQEALLLLYSAAFTQGTNVRLELEAIEHGVWFRVLFSRLTPLPDSFEALLDSFGGHWRAQDTVFELATARDFVRLNGGEIEMNLAKQQGTFSFFVRQIGASKEKSQPVLVTSETPLMLDTPLPVKAEAKDINATPVVSQKEIDEIPAIPPTLAALRFPPGEASVPAPTPKEGQTPLIEPEERSPNTPYVPQEYDDTHISLKTALLPPLPPSLHPSRSTGSKSPEKPKSVIMPIKIPPPTPPNTLHNPPAATSNVALTKDTQTLRPVSDDDSTRPPAEGPNTANDDTKILPAKKAPDSSSREEKS